MALPTAIWARREICAWCQWPGELLGGVLTDLCLPGCLWRWPEPSGDLQILCWGPPSPTATKYSRHSLPIPTPWTLRVKSDGSCLPLWSSKASTIPVQPDAVCAVLVLFRAFRTGFYYSVKKKRLAHAGMSFAIALKHTSHWSPVAVAKGQQCLQNLKKRRVLGHKSLWNCLLSRVAWCVWSSSLIWLHYSISWNGLFIDKPLLMLKVRLWSIILGEW